MPRTKKPPVLDSGESTPVVPAQPVMTDEPAITESQAAALLDTHKVIEQRKPMTWAETVRHYPTKTSIELVTFRQPDAIGLSFPETAKADTNEKIKMHDHGLEYEGALRAYVMRSAPVADQEARRDQWKAVAALKDEMIQDRLTKSQSAAIGA
jgi:hypothetical protein